MPTADWCRRITPDPPKILGVKDTDSKGSRPTLYGFSVLNVSEKPHAVTVSAYSEASRPHKRYQVDLNAQHIPHSFSLFSFLNGQASPFTHRLAVLPKARFTIYIDAYKPSHFSPPRKTTQPIKAPVTLGSRHISSNPHSHYLRLPSTLGRTTWQVISTPISLAYRTKSLLLPENAS